MCNLYNLTTNQEAMRRLFRVDRDRFGNLEPSIDVYPDRSAPVLRLDADGGRELAPLVWGMPSPPAFVAAGRPDTGITNIRNAASSWWQRWTGPRNRCVVPWTSFCEWEDTSPRKTQRWFAIREDKPLAVFAGIWTEWSGVRGSARNPRAGRHELFAFLTCAPNRVVAQVHPKAMPVILTTEDEIHAWLAGPWNEARELQRPLAEDGLVLLPPHDAPPGESGPSGLLPGLIDPARS